MRSSVWRPRLYLTSNADGVGLSWFKKDYVLPCRNHTERFTRFFNVTYKEDPFLDESYVRWLEGLKGPPGRAWRDADWDAFAGMAFPSWDYDRHVIEFRNTFEIPVHWPKWVAIDWGYAQPFCALWLTKNPDTRRTYVYREVYQAGLTSKQQARMLEDFTPPDEKISIYYADPVLWQRKDRAGEVFTTADEYKAEGLVLRKGDTDRLGGMRKIHTLLADTPDGQPGLQVFETCPHLIEQLSTLALDQMRVEDVDTDQEDHAFDTLKYGLTNENKVGLGPTHQAIDENPMNLYFNRRR